MTDLSVGKNLKKLRENIKNFALSSKEFSEELRLASEEIIEGATNASSEATVEGIFERVIYATLREIGIKFHPEKEVFVETCRHTGTGRADSRIGSVVIEYKHRSKLKSEKNISYARKQIEDYLSSFSIKLDNEIIGFLTDGLSIYEIRASKGEILSSSGELKINNKTLLNFILAIDSLEKSALTSENLIRDFCGNSYQGVLFDLARILNTILINKSTAKTDMLRSEWEELFRLAHEDQSQQRRIQERRILLSEIFEEKLDDASSEYRTLFALHTSYAIVLKSIAYRVVADLRFGSPLQDYKSLIGTDSQMLRSFYSDLEDGEIFRRLGILNLLEGDFFSWYSDENQWNDELSNALQQILETLGRYEDISKIFSTVDSIELFKELYEATVPQVVRASFGEFYTPIWLAQHVLQSSGLKDDWRILDTCGGSGTFVIAAISLIRKENKEKTKEEVLNQILYRVAAIDLNPLSVLTTRVHYFIHIADLLPENTKNLVIPVFLGDSSYVPEKVNLFGVKCLRYQLRTLKNPISIELPISLVENTSKFVQLMYDYEQYVKNEDNESASKLLIDSLCKKDKTQDIEEKIINLTQQLVDLEIKKWNGIWARIITNFLTTACLGPFTNVIGNPPWIDWKNLPAGYREKVKSICIDKGLFSGAGRTGGINLNICALITHVSATNWLDKTGKLAFLMPKELAYQASYEGWRKSVGGENRKLLEFHDWSRAGDPFYPVKEDFMTYIIGKRNININNKLNIIPATQYIKKRSCKTKAHQWTSIEEAMGNLDVIQGFAGQVTKGSTAFTFAKTKNRLYEYEKIAGDCAYIGREGVEFYPQELLIFEYDGPGPRQETVFVRNIQQEKSKYRIPRQRIILETKYLFPLVRGRTIERFSHNNKNLIVPFPYDKDPHKPIDAKHLEKQSPLLLSYYKKYQRIIKDQTPFSDKIRGPDAGEFYGLARTGPYSFQNIYVAFRDNTKWRAVVVGSENMPWGERKRFLFQNHAVSICERSDKGGYINEDEAHYICAILNAPIVEDYIYASSDNRSFKIRPPIYIPKYDEKDIRHKKLSDLSKTAHNSHNSDIDLQKTLNKIEELYLEICEDK